MNNDANNYWIIWITFLVGLFLQIMPWSSIIYMLKPSWLLLILIYWVLALPHRVGITTAFIVGLIWDVFSGTVLGVHAFMFSCVAYLVLFRYQLLRNLALWQQSFVVFGLSLFANILLYVFEIIIYQSLSASPTFVLSSISNGVLWTWMFLLLRQIRRRFAIY